MSRSDWQLVTRELRQRRRALARVAGWSLVEALPAMASGALISLALDEGFLAHRPLVGLGWLAGFGLTMLIGAVGTRAVFPHLAATVEPLRDALVRRLVDASLTRAVAGVDRGDSSGVARLVNLAEGVRKLVSALLRTLRPLVFKLAAALVGVVALAPSIALIVAPPLLLALAASVALTRVMAGQQRTVLLAEEAIAQASGAVVAGIRDVVACAAQQPALAGIDRSLDAHVRGARRMASLTSLRTLIIGLGGVLPLLALLAATPWLIRQGQLLPGEIVGAVTYLSATLVPTLGALVGTIGSSGLELYVVLRRLREATTLPADAPKDVLPDQAGALPGPSLQLHGLTFAYGPHAQPVLDDFHLDVPPGDHLAIVGPSGIGKSTLARLLIGDLHPQAGEVRLNGIRLTDISAHVARTSMALIPQEAYIFAGTLRENLAYLHPHATESELDASVDAVGLRPLVRRLGSYDTWLGPETAQLSSGERQLIALTRVHLSPAGIVVLDEATCHLDPAAEARAEQAFAARGGTLIVIAHRITSARRARRVLLFADTGPVLGSHAELQASSPLYAELVGHWRTPPRPPHQASPSRYPGDGLPTITAG
ncbi:ATP-binding cassette domain-containing protein [Streptomyces sp. P1-3]|uniref:ATP-binding cassette domain-containing protein n=1 Tax=Streptomyces sp. P1-3 TaxID=3421658 RepID=UPI003D36FC4C